MNKRQFIQQALGTSLALLWGCGGGGGENSASAPAPASLPVADTTVDFLHWATVPNQVTTQASFELEVIADNLNPLRNVEAPVAVDAFGVRHLMAIKILKWPGTTTDSVAVYAATVPLKGNQVNALSVVSGSKTLTMNVVQKSSIDLQVANDSAQLFSLVRSALTASSVDVIELQYDEADLGAALDGVGNSLVNSRTSWLTIQPAAGRTIRWNRDSATPMRRPKADWLHWHQGTLGSDTCDQGGGHWYIEPNHRVWLSSVESRGQYKASWPKTTKQTVAPSSDLRMNITEAQKLYFTQCSWDGTAANVALLAVELGRDLSFRSHRGDFSDFGKVILNVVAEDIAPIRNAADTDYLHNDGFQIWGNEGTQDLVFKGFRVTSPTVGADLQPFLFDRTYSPQYARILLDTIQIEGSNTILKAQLAGAMSDVRLSNLKFPGQALTIRQDFVEPNGAFAPTRVFIANVEVKDVEYLAPAGGTNLILSTATTANPDDVSPNLNDIAGLSGASFQAVKVVWP